MLESSLDLPLVADEPQPLTLRRGQLQIRLDTNGVDRQTNPHRHAERQVERGGDELRS